MCERTDLRDVTLVHLHSRSPPLRAASLKQAGSFTVAKSPAALAADQREQTCRCGVEHLVAAARET